MNKKMKLFHLSNTLTHIHKHEGSWLSGCKWTFNKWHSRNW